MNDITSEINTLSESFTFSDDSNVVTLVKTVITAVQNKI